MAIIRWGPRDEMAAMINQFNKMLEDMAPGEERGRLEKAAWVPPVDAWETASDFHLVFDIPGVEKEKIEIEVDKDQLTIKGEREPLADIRYLRKERVYGPFFRAFTLETPIEREQIKAVFKSGVLEVILPKKEEVKPKQIQIQIGDE